MRAVYTLRVDAVNMIAVGPKCDNRCVETRGERLRIMRERAGFTSARSAALHINLTQSTYAAHENGQNDYELEQAIEYANAFKKAALSPVWLITGRNPIEFVSSNSTEMDAFCAMLKAQPPALQKRLRKVILALIEDEKENQRGGKNGTEEPGDE
jgi:DNA-binding XRE family transcriptional regulator